MAVAFEQRRALTTLMVSLRFYFYLWSYYQMTEGTLSLKNKQTALPQTLTPRR